MATVFGPADEKSLKQLERCRDASGEPAPGVLCADHHLGYSMPIGGAIALKDKVMPAGVGYDIACGNCAVQTEIKADDLDTAKVMDEIASVLSFGVGRKNNETVDDPVIDMIAHAYVKEQAQMVDLARSQLGTIGSSNHYVDLFRDGTGYVWVGVHFGSRGFGHKTASGFLALAQGKRWGEKASEGGMESAPSFIDLSRPLGQDYLTAMQLAGQYAYAGRNWVVNRVLKMLGTVEQYRVHNHHNFAWWETHGDERYLVIRKGATPAFPGQTGFIGASMGEDAVIVTGLDSERSRAALYSTVHGAGRVMSRTEAAGPFVKQWKCLDYRSCDGTLPASTLRASDGSNPRCPKCGGRTKKSKRRERDASKGRIKWDQTVREVFGLGVELRGGGADEAPAAYKRLPDVLAYHEGTIRIDYRLTPIGVAMAGANEFDPYKD